MSYPKKQSNLNQDLLHLSELEYDKGQEYLTCDNRKHLKSIKEIFVEEVDQEIYQVQKINESKTSHYQSVAQSEGSSYDHEERTISFVIMDQNIMYEQKFMNELNNLLELQQQDITQSELSQESQVEIQLRIKYIQDTLSQINSNTLSNQESSRNPPITANIVLNTEQNSHRSMVLDTIYSELQTIGKPLENQSRQQYIQEMTQAVMTKLINFQDQDHEDRVAIRRQKDALQYIEELKYVLFPGLDETYGSEYQESQLNAENQDNSVPVLQQESQSIMEGQGKEVIQEASQDIIKESSQETPNNGTNRRSKRIKLKVYKQDCEVQVGENVQSEHHELQTMSIQVKLEPILEEKPVIVKVDKSVQMDEIFEESTPELVLTPKIASENSQRENNIAQSESQQEQPIQDDLEDAVVIAAETEFNENTELLPIETPLIEFQLIKTLSKTSSAKTLSQTFDVKEVIKDADEVYDQVARQNSQFRIRNNPSKRYELINIVTHDKQDCHVMIDKLHTKMNKVWNNDHQDKLSTDLERTLLKNVDHSRVYCNGSQLKKSLIDINKSFGIVQEIRRRSNQMGHSRSKSVNQGPLEETQKWSKVIQYMEKNPQVMINMLPTPRTQVQRVSQNKSLSKIQTQYKRNNYLKKRVQSQAHYYKSPVREKSQEKRQHFLNETVNLLKLRKSSYNLNSTSTMTGTESELRKLIKSRIDQRKQIMLAQSQPFHKFENEKKKQFIQTQNLMIGNITRPQTQQMRSRLRKLSNITDYFKTNQVETLNPQTFDPTSIGLASNMNLLSSHYHHNIRSETPTISDIYHKDQQSILSYPADRQNFKDIKVSLHQLLHKRNLRKHIASNLNQDLPSEQPTEFLENLHQIHQPTEESLELEQTDLKQHESMRIEEQEPSNEDLNENTEELLNLYHPISVCELPQVDSGTRDDLNLMNIIEQDNEEQNNQMEIHSEIVERADIEQVKSPKCLIRTIQSDEYENIQKQIEEQKLAQENQQQFQMGFGNQLNRSIKNLQFAASQQQQQTVSPSKPKTNLIKDLNETPIFLQLTGESIDLPSEHLTFQQIDDLIFQFRRKPTKMMHQLPEILAQALDQLEFSMTNLGLLRVFRRYKKQLEQINNPPDIKITFKLLHKCKLMKEAEINLRDILEKFLEFDKRHVVIENLRDERMEDELIQYQVDELQKLEAEVNEKIEKFLEVQTVYKDSLNIYGRDIKELITEFMQQYK